MALLRAPERPITRLLWMGIEPVLHRRANRRIAVTRYIARRCQIEPRVRQRRGLRAIFVTRLAAPTNREQAERSDIGQHSHCGFHSSRSEFFLICPFRAEARALGRETQATLCSLGR